VINPGGPDQSSSFPIGATTPGGLRRGIGALAERNYRLFWLGQVVNVAGSGMQQVSLPWLVLALGGTPIQLGLVGMMQFVPAFFLAPFGGVLADRVDKRRVLVAAHVAAMGQAAVLFGLTASGFVTIEIVIAMAGWLGVVNAVEMPFRQSFVADLVPRHLLPNAIALSTTANQSARVVGPALAGAILALGGNAFGTQAGGVAPSLGINVLTYLAIVVALLCMDPAVIARTERPDKPPSVFLSLREGLTFARDTPIVLWPLALIAGIVALGYNFQILLPLLTRDVLGLGAGYYGGLFALLGLGSLAGSLTLAFMERRPAAALMIRSAVVFSLALGGLGLARTAWIAFPLVLVVGYCWVLVANTVNFTIQANVPDPLRGRVMSLYVAAFVGSSALGNLFAGAVAESWGASIAFVICAVLFLAVVGVVAWQLNVVSTAGRLRDPSQ
jgi:MFS family permease